MIMKKIYIKPLMKDHKLQHTNGLLVVASKLVDDDGNVYDGLVDDDDEEAVEGGL